MKLVVLGATGRTGAFLLDEAEAQKHVRTIVGVASATGPRAPQQRASR
jgi:putative NADH-flavin reductase